MPDETVAEPSMVAPSRKTILPVASEGLTVAFRVMDCPSKPPPVVTEVVVCGKIVCWRLALPRRVYLITGEARRDGMGAGAERGILNTTITVAVQRRGPDSVAVGGDCYGGETGPADVEPDRFAEESRVTAGRYRDARWLQHVLEKDCGGWSCSSNHRYKTRRCSLSPGTVG